MEWSWRTLLILIALVAIAAILVDGFRRMRRARAEALRLDVSHDFKFPASDHNPELPGGGFRVVGGKRTPLADDGEADFSQADLKLPGFKSTTSQDARTTAAHGATGGDKNKRILIDDFALQDDEPGFADAVASVVIKKESAPAKTTQAESKKPSAFTASAVAEKTEHAVKNPAAGSVFTESVADDALADEPFVAIEEKSAIDAKNATEPAFSANWFEPAAEADEEPIIAWQDDVSPARVISAEKAAEKQHEPVAERVHDLEIPRSPLIPKARPVNLDEAVPVLLDVEELGADDVEPVYAEADDLREAADTHPPVSEGVVAVAEEAQAADSVAPAMHNSFAGTELTDTTDEATDTDPHLEQEVDDIPAELVSQPVNFAGANAESLAARPMPELVLEIHCIAHDPIGFSGKDILFLFNSCDLRFGEKKIFHRFEEPDGQGCIQFSVAQSYEPGIFVPAAMAQQHFRGLSFFMSLPGAKRPMEAYEAMSEMALVIARKLRADLYDGARSALTPQTMEHDRQQIMDYERRQKLAQKKQARR
ncbi:cell division protein ZipA C-terminal FtsZ-binding domain-containing protein [Thalassolituus sp. LLYu03]|uniref:cell division protein ZipA C-terminal FtsZ-binding domain-containing protein n=1 Tax=Thalassolituus sp. LLYu03 TaxID=3421656 RepID=UPI003D29B0B9